MKKELWNAECSCAPLLFLAAAGLSEQVFIMRDSWSDSPGCDPDAEEGRAVAEAQQDASLVSRNEPDTAASASREHRQDAAGLQVPQAPQAQLSC